PGGEAFGSGERDELGQPAGFGASHGQAEGRDPVVAAALVVQVRVRPFLGLGDEPLFEHPVDGAVQGPGAEAHGVVGAGRDVLDEGIAVQLAVGEGHQDVEGRRRQGKEGFDLGAVLLHGEVIYPQWLYCQWIYSEWTDCVPLVSLAAARATRLVDPEPKFQGWGRGGPHLSVFAR